MRYINTLILILILGSLAGIGYFLYQIIDTKETPPVQEVNKVVGNGEQKETTDTPVIANDTGSVTGKLCYPSEFIPEMNVFLVDTLGGSVLSQTVPQNTQNYAFSEVPAGSYIAFAYLATSTETGGSYSAAVPCGLTVACTNHEPLEVVVSKGSTVSNVDICDWYSPEDVPAKPSL